MEKQLNSAIENTDSSSIVRRLLQIKLAVTASTTNGTGPHTKMLNNEDELFDPSLLTKLDWNNKKASYKCDVSPASPGKDLELRPLSYHDYDKGFINILSQLTVTGDVTQESFTERFQAMKSCPNTYYVAVIEDIRKKQVVGTATLVVEQKFIHSTATRGRIEDVVVDKNCRGLELGKLLIDTLVLLAESFGCYKLTLECKEENVTFYKTLGFDVYEQLNMIRRIKD